MTSTEKIEMIKDIIKESGLTGSKITIEEVVKEMEKVTFKEVAELIVEMGSLIKDIKDISEF